MKTILAIDASTKSTGTAIFKDKELVKWNCFTNTSTDLIKRIKYMTEKIQNLIQENPQIQQIILQQVRPQSGPNIKTQKALMYLQASLQFMLHDNFPKIKVQYIYPNSWRSKCGIKVGAGVKRDTLKQQDMKFVKDTYGLEVNDDIADAICIGHSQVNPKEKGFFI